MYCVSTSANCRADSTVLDHAAGGRRDTSLRVRSRIGRRLSGCHQQTPVAEAEVACILPVSACTETACWLHFVHLLMLPGNLNAVWKSPKSLHCPLHLVHFVQVTHSFESLD